MRSLRHVRTTCYIYTVCHRKYTIGPIGVRSAVPLLFGRRYGAKFIRKLEELVDEEIFTLDEVQQLRSYNNNLAESVWTWVAHIVAALYKKGEIKSEHVLTFLMERR